MLQLLAYVVLLGEVHMFLELSWIGLFGANIAYVHLETPQLQEVFLSKSNTILTGIQCAVAPASNMNGFLSEIHVFLQLSWIGLFGTKLAYLQHEIVICIVYYSRNLTKFSQENNALNGAVSNIDGFLEIFMSFFNSGENYFLEQQYLPSPWST